MHSELCNRCGSCVGLSGGKIIFKNKEKKYRPEIVGEVSADEAERLWNACPGKEFNFPKYRKHFYPATTNFHEYTGPYESFYIGYANDNTIRKNSASGGLISAILIYLLDKKKIDGAITLRMSKDKPWLSEPFVATTREEILEAAQSKYTISSVNEILAQTSEFNGRLAYVGIPPQVQSIRKLQKANDPSVRNIEYIFGPFYGNTLFFSSIKSFLKSYKESDYTKIKKLYFRYGEWPGSMRIEMKSGKIIQLKKFHANYLIPFHIVTNSLYCTDFTNEFTDISGGDAWAPVYEERGKGFSLIITRNNKGQVLLESMINDGYLTVDPISKNQAIEMHSHGYDFKKRGSFIRIELRKIIGQSIPNYGYKPGGIPLRRYLMEMIINSLFWILSSKVARYAVEQIPPETIGKLFEKTRTIWKKSTYSIKRDNLA
ncbi:MAG: Coenzyme F420 hydrogenase/dehydrogenase, beta subunit C-terminal domain [bacterium]